MAREPNLVLINKNKRTSHLSDIAIPADNRVKKKAKNLILLEN